MRVLIYGLEGKNTLGRMCKRGFEASGHTVEYFARPQWPLGLRWLLNGRGTEKIVEAAATFNPELALIVHGRNLDRETIQSIRMVSDATVVNWYPDNPFEERSEERRDTAYLDTVPAYDLVFTWGEHLLDSLRDCGAERVKHLPFGFDPCLHRPLDPSPEFECDAIFLGHWSKKRELFLSALTELDLSVYGNGWFRKCRTMDLRRAHEGKALQGEAYAWAMSSAKIIVNVVADHNLPSHNMRTFEVPPTESLMLTTRTDGQKEFFEENKEVAMYESPEELRQKAVYYLAEDEERESVAAKGAQTVQGHDYARRMQQIVNAVKEL